jgi:glutathione S-transferase
MITVHHLNNSRSQRVLWLLEELGLKYEIKRYQRDPDTLLAPASLREVHPLGKSPVITDGALTLAESGAIIEYLVERYANGKLSPAPNTPERLRYTYWLHYAEGSLMPLIVMQLVFGQVEKKAPFLLRPVAGAIAHSTKSSFLNPQLTLHLNYMEAELNKTTWFAGNEFTAADIQLSFPLEAATARGSLNTNQPNLTAFLERIHSRPAYQSALKRGGEYQLLS